MCTVWEPASAGPTSCLKSVKYNSSTFALFANVPLHSRGASSVSKNLGIFITDKKTRVLLFISKSPWQGDILETSIKVTVIKTPGVKAQSILKNGTQTQQRWNPILKTEPTKAKMLDNQTKPKSVFTTSYQYGDHNEEYVFACKGRPFAALISDILPTPDTNLIDHNLVRELGLKMTNLQCRKFNFTGHKMRVLERVSTAVQ